MTALLFEYKFILTAGQNQLYDFTIGISTGEIKFEQIVEWLKQNTKAIK